MNAISCQTHEILNNHCFFLWIDYFIYEEVKKIPINISSFKPGRAQAIYLIA